MKKENRLPEFWAVYNDGSQRFKDTVINYLNTIHPVGLDGNLGYWYGYDGMNKASNGVFCARSTSEMPATVQPITLDEFIELTTPEPGFKEGDAVEGSDDGMEWISGKYGFHSQLNGLHYLHRVGDTFFIGWKKCRKQQPAIEITCKIDGKEVPLSEVPIRDLMKQRHQSRSCVK